MNNNFVTVTRKNTHSSRGTRGRGFSGRGFQRGGAQSYQTHNNMNNDTMNTQQPSQQQSNQMRPNNRFVKVIVKSVPTKRKSSRTVLVKGEDVNKQFSYEGLQNQENSPQGNIFLVFDTLENARKAFKDLRQNKINCKYSYYKLFFKTSVQDAISDYDTTKTAFMTLLKEKASDVNVLYFKFYRKNNVFTGSGDFVVDRKVDCDTFVTMKTANIVNAEFSFYRYRNNNVQVKKSDTGSDSGHSDVSE